MIRLTPEKYIQIGTDTPDHRMVFSGWDFEVKYYFFYLIPVIIYTKKLLK